MRIYNKAYSIYELGARANQEDCIWPDSATCSSDVYILCDGMGGHDNGEVASQTVCESMSTYINEHCEQNGYFDHESFDRALSAAYDALDAKDVDESVKKMGTTLTFVKFHSGGCFVAHIGDSRIYQIRPSEKGADRIVFVTRDHSLVNDLIALGEMTPDEAKTSNQRNVITRAMQPHQERRSKADCINLTDVREGDYFYMCSDGMLEVSEDNEIADILSTSNSDAQKIAIFKEVTANNKDNHSAFLIKVTSVEDIAEELATEIGKSSIPNISSVSSPSVIFDKTLSEQKDAENQYKSFIIAVVVVVIMVVAMLLSN